MHTTSKIFFAGIFFLFYVFPTLGQQPIGHHINLDGIPIEGHLDLLLFNSNKEVLLYPEDYFERGYYWQINGEKVKGLFSLQGSTLYFKGKSYNEQEKISPGMVKGLIIEKDSFFAMSNEFVQPLKTIGDISFARTIRSNFIKYYPVYFIKQGHDAPWQELPRKRKKLIKFLAPFLSDYSFTLDRLVDGYFKADEMSSIIEHIKMESAYNNAERLYYNKAWEQVENEEEALYHGRIIERKDSLWTIDYYLDTGKIYTVTYSDFAPNRINGNVKAYGDNGNVRLDMMVSNDIIKKVTSYHPNAKLHRDYDLYNNNVIAYTKVFAESGDEISDKSGSFQERFEDAIIGGTLVRNYSGFQLTESYREIEGRRIYQITDIGFDFYVGELQRKMSSNGGDKASVSSNETIIALVRLQIDEKGNLEDYKILNKVPYGFKNPIQFFLRTHSKNGHKKLSLKRYKVNGKLVAYEIVVPFHYIDSRPQRNTVNPFFNDFYLINRQMQWDIQHQQMLNSIQAPNPIR